jgi:hypothetical protein
MSDFKKVKFLVIAYFSFAPSPRWGEGKGEGKSNGQNSMTQEKSSRSFEIGALNYVENTFPNPPNPPLRGWGDLWFSRFAGEEPVM